MSEATGKSGRTIVNVGQATEADLAQDFIKGNNNNSGRAPTREETWGITAQPMGEPTATGPSEGQLAIEAHIAAERAANPSAIQGEQQQQQREPEPEESVDHWKRLYGDSENKFGEERRARQEAEETLNAVLGELETLRSQATTQPSQYQGAQPMYQPPQYPQNYAPNVNVPDYTKGLGDDDFVPASSLRNLVQDFQAALPQVAQYASQQAYTQAQQDFQRLERQIVEGRKTAAGLTRVDEYRILAKHPYLRNIPSEAQRTEAILNLWQQQRQAQGSNGQTAQAQPAPTTEVARNVVRRVTYSENTQPSADDLKQGAVQSTHDREMAEAMNAPLIDPVTGLTRAERMRKIAQKYGYRLGDGGVGVISR